jgi:hypothetical protein
VGPTRALCPSVGADTTSEKETIPVTDFQNEETTTDFRRDETTLCGANPQCGEPGYFTDASGCAACREHGGVAPRDLPPDTRRLVASATARRDYGAVARILGDADVDLAWLTEELTQTTRPRAHPLAVDLVRIGVEPHLLVPYLPPATLAESPRAQLRRDRVARAVRALHCEPTADDVPDELRYCYRRHGEVLAERDALRRELERQQRGHAAQTARGAVEAVAPQAYAELARVLAGNGVDLARLAEVLPPADSLRQRVAELEAERDALAKRLREAQTYDHFSDLPAY